MKLLTFLTLGTLAIVLVGCSQKPRARIVPMDSFPLQRLADRNVEAGASLAAQIKEQYGPIQHRYIEPPVVVLVATLVNLDDLTKTTPFGRMVSEQISVELDRRNIRLREVRRTRDVMVIEPRQGEFALSRDVSLLGADVNASHVMAGTYRLIGNVAYVSVRVIDIKTHHVIASVDYSILIDKTIAELFIVPAEERTIGLRPRNPN